MARDPQAVLLLYEKDKLFKSQRYFLFQGANTISADPGATVLLPQEQTSGCSAVIQIHANRLVTIRDTSPGEPWLQKLSSLPPASRIWLEKGRQYEILPQREFWVGGRKCIYKGDSAAELRKIANVVNSALAGTAECDQLTEKDESNQVEDIGSTLLVSGEIGATLLVNSFESSANQFQPSPRYNATLLVSSQDCLESTLLVDNYGGVQSTLLAEPLLDSTLIVGEHLPLPAVRAASLGQTIQNTPGQEVDATVMDEELAQAGPGPSQPSLSSSALFQKSSSFKKTSQMVRVIGTEIMKKYRELDNAARAESLFDLLAPNAPIVGLQKPEASRSKPEEAVSPESKPTVQKKKVVCFSGFRPSEGEKNLAAKLNLKVMEDGQQDFDLLIIKELKKSPKLLLALVKGVPIHTKEYLYRKLSTPFGKIDGWTWDQISHRSTSNLLRNKLLQNEKFFFAGEADCKDLVRLSELMGAVVLKRLAKVSRTSVLLGRADREFYEAHKGQKNLQFFGIGLLEEAALMCVVAKQKHRVDDLYFDSK